MGAQRLAELCGQWRIERGADVLRRRDAPGGRGDEADVDPIVDGPSPLDLWSERGLRRPLADPEMVDVDRELDRSEAARGIDVPQRADLIRAVAPDLELAHPRLEDRR